MNASGICKEILTQDNAITAEPIFMVTVAKRIYGLSPDYSEHTTWIDEDGEEVKQDDLGIRPTWTEVGYLDIRVNVQPFFTRVGAQAYIDANRHNLSDPDIYVESGSRNTEWKTVRAFLSVVNKPTP